MAAVFSAFGIGFSDLGQRYEQPLTAADYATVRQAADRLLAPLPHVTLGGGGDADASEAQAGGTRPLRDGRGGQAETPVYTLERQRPGARGPAVIEGPFFTMRVPPGWQFDITAASDLRLTDRGQ